ncbi:hypothetical protein LRQ11_13305, partial [Pseudomonas sp. MAFF 311095]
GLAVWFRTKMLINQRLLNLKPLPPHQLNRRVHKMKSEETVEYALESDIAFSTTNESEDISFFMDLADDELMLQAVFSRC